MRWAAITSRYSRYRTLLPIGLSHSYLSRVLAATNPMKTSFLIATAILVLLAACGSDASEPTPQLTTSGRPTSVAPTPTALPSGSTPTITPQEANPASTPGQVQSASGDSSGVDPLQSAGVEPQVPGPVTSFPDPPERDLYQIAAALIPGVGPINRVVNPEPVSYEAGRLDTFWLVDLNGLERYQSTFELRLVTPHAYWYVEEGQSISQDDLEESAAKFESTVYPRVTAAFGNEWVPGVDNDAHLNVLNARLTGVGGYFSSGDEYPQSVKPNSNQREVIYINTGSIPVSSQTYTEVLAHELQHAVHWNADASEESWVNEGLAELAIAISGEESASIGRFLRSGPTSLVNWPLSVVASTGSYGSASLFMHYLTEHYGGRDDLRPLVSQDADGIAGINDFLREGGYGVDFEDVFRDWAVANFLDEDEGLYGYGDIDVQVSEFSDLKPGSVLESEIPQYATEYVELESLDGPATVSFQGTTEAALLPVDVGPSGCWWSNSGDSIDSTLSRLVDLRTAGAATLNYQVWFNLEEGWDYAYLEVSTDGGDTWSIIETPNTFPDDHVGNPIGNAFGPGYTGESPDWLQESVSLGDYLGTEVWVRFQYITDDAINGPGLCVREPEIEADGKITNAQDWVANGFIFVDNRVRQRYIVQLIQSGGENLVMQVELDENNFGQITVERPQDFERTILAVQSLAPSTRQPATYSLRLEPLY